MTCRWGLLLLLLCRRVDASSASALSGRTTLKYGNRHAAISASRGLPALAKRTRVTFFAKYPPLQALPPEYQPTGARWNNTIAICVSMRDENVTDVREWLLYHRWLGVDHVILTENNSREPIESGILDFIAAGFVSYRQERQPFALLKAYYECFKSYRHRFGWMAFIDADEHIVVRDKTATLKSLLDEFKGEVGLGLHWVSFGPSGRRRRPIEGGVLRNYVRCGGAPMPQTKTIVNLYYMATIANHPHSALFWDKRTPVNEARTHAEFHHERKIIPQAVILPPSADRVALFHYQTKSWEDFQIKMKRRGGDGLPKAYNYYVHVNRTTQSDDPICSELAAIADSCCPM